MSTHTPLIELKSAQSAYNSAVQCCPHWDYESDGQEHQCCRELDDAQRRLSRAKKAVRAMAGGTDEQEVWDEERDERAEAFEDSHDEVGEAFDDKLAMYRAEY